MANLVTIAHTQPTLARPGSAAFVSPGSSLPCPEMATSPASFQLPLNARLRTYGPLLRFTRVWTLSKEPAASDGMKALLSAEGVKKSQLENGVRKREKTGVCFNYGCSAGSRGQVLIKHARDTWEGETGKKGLRI